MTDETGTGDADYKLVAGVVKRALKDAARGDAEAAAFLAEMLPNTRTVNQRMGDWIRNQASKGVTSFTTGLPVTATTPAAKRTDANAGNTGTPNIKESTARQMNKAIRRAAGRETAE